MYPIILLCFAFCFSNADTDADVQKRPRCFDDCGINQISAKYAALNHSRFDIFCEEADDFLQCLSNDCQSLPPQWENFVSAIEKAIKLGCVKYFDDIKPTLSCYMKYQKEIDRKCSECMPLVNEQDKLLSKPIRDGDWETTDKLMEIMCRLHGCAWRCGFKQMCGDKGEEMIKAFHQSMRKVVSTLHVATIQLENKEPPKHSCLHYAIASDNMHFDDASQAHGDKGHNEL